MPEPTLNRRGLLVSALAAAAAVVPSAATATPLVSRVAVGRRPGAIAVNSATGTVYVANTGDGTVSVLDVAGGGRVTLRHTVPVARTVTDAAVHEDTGAVYVSNARAGTVSVLDGDGGVFTTIAAGPGAAVLGVDETAGVICVGSARTGAVTLLDGTGHTLSAVLPGTGGPRSGVAVDPGRRRAYLASADRAGVEVLDLVRREFTGGFGVGRAPEGIAVHRTTGTIHVANAGIHHLSIVDGETLVERDTVLLRSAASSVAVHQATGTVYTNGGPNGIARVDGAAAKLTGELSLGINPGAVAVDQRTGTVYVADPVHDAVLVITDF
ncbi:YVTN family beta-propeller protein [Prauserella shujinwangii]|uniref:YVTN family beta-propeller protein n=1 Tax=Prauserella shujinwangii TaxID=1453103 RepID=A0A2T0LQN2_9PSEU|nr:YncE family protein [Prauserella shujinwangii]PRX45644.1 YVTN family beta-propeller protein [Prauserella shujinwangii]